MNFSLITLATSLVAIASSKSITLELYKSHAKTKTGKVLPLDQLAAEPSVVNGTFTSALDVVDGYMYTVQMMAGTNATSGQPMNAGTFLVSTGNTETFIYSDTCYANGTCPDAPIYKPAASSTYIKGPNNGVTQASTGMRMKSDTAFDTLCLGSGGETDRLCLDHMEFNMVNSIDAKDWQQVFYQDAYATNGIFGLGMVANDTYSNQSSSFLARAVALGQIDEYEYSFQMAPNDTVGSQLVLGKYDGTYTDKTKWVNMAVGSNGWEGNVTGTWVDNTTCFPDNSTEYSANFETGYPYIGMPADVFENMADQIEDLDKAIDCNHGFCSAEKLCSEMVPLGDITFLMGGLNFTMPMNSTFYQTYNSGNKNNRHKVGQPICMILLEKLQQVSHSSPAETGGARPIGARKLGSGASDTSHTPGGKTFPVFRFGDVFFKSFFTTYNIPQKNMGFAVSNFAASGTSITSNSPISNNKGLLIGIGIGSVLLIAAMVSAAIYCKYYKKPNAEESERLNAIGVYDS